MRRVLTIYILHIAPLSPVTFRVFVGGHSAKSCCCSPCIHLFRPHWLHASFVCRPSYVLKKKICTMHKVHKLELTKWKSGTTALSFASTSDGVNLRVTKASMALSSTFKHEMTLHFTELPDRYWVTTSSQFYKSLRSPAATYWSTLQRLQELYGWTFDTCDDDDDDWILSKEIVTYKMLYMFLKVQF